MLDKIIQFSVGNKLIIGLFTLGLILSGIYSLMRLPIDAVPDITNNQVQVITTSPSLAAEEVERLITFPIEIAMSTIADIEEIRSFSRFGLSVVTIVFKENTDVYHARQLVSERLAGVEDQIPTGIGQPGMAPMTTGLGEIYQYVVGVVPGYENRYDAMELRSIQDWIVRRQLLGTSGVADVSSFGGYVKQFEIAIDPQRLNAMNISIKNIFQALEANNENTGGAYIEKGPNAYFIRSEGLVTGIEDIKHIKIKNNSDGIPVLIGDVSSVQLGNAIRYGATTRNGEGEVVSAIVMMLKGENSSKVIENVKLKINEIRKTLPEGVTIEPFIDRTKLVNKAIGTVTKNLIEGALIVIFILLLLLGNLRAGLIVASVIPLALLFAFTMMNLFGVSGNLMSLGAIDFGLIVDGAVIIVEAILHHLGFLKPERRLTQSEMDEEVYHSAGKIRNSAAFGEIIILIVYLPILALIGTEGKMFRPMAQTVSFAILGAFILSLTYIPMMSALLLNKHTSYKKTISDRLMSFFHNLYNPVIHIAMHKRPVVLVSVFLLFLSSLWIFSSMGGEFVPTLEEGDFAVETRVMTGSSLNTTIDATTRAEKIILAQFPEVEQVVAKIGSGEIPTDPMPVEAADLMIILKDKSEWVSATSREDLANKMSEALEEIPGVSFGFQQPIQMRFNELMTGVRQDVAIKIYGEDLELLSEYADEIGKLAGSIAGVVDLYIEEVTGVPQIVISYKRDQLAKYGLSIRDVNQSVRVAFAGAVAGLVYEGEKRFDLVLRLDKTNRNNLDDVRNLYISREDGHQIPLHQVAVVEVKEGPYQIQRDNARRRIIVAFNVRGRDVESVVGEIQQEVDRTIILQPGYSITYGGQFENLIEARQRLSIAVPAALLLIFVLLFFTFGSVKQSLLIFTAIPLSAIGGIFALWFRGMPFSISAGVGFIALFGVAVLNGIVLIAEFNRLKKAGVSDILDRIYKGTERRLRPVIMTAAVASFGFLPMALSLSSGAEVQRPLATVVIGGLITATFLTMVVLPVLYYYFEKGIKIKPIIPVILFVSVVFVNGNTAGAQDSTRSYRSLDELIKAALENNPGLKKADLQRRQQIALKAGSVDIPKTNFRWKHGQYNSIHSNDNQFIVSQTFAFPTTYANSAKLAREKIVQRELMVTATASELVRMVKTTYYLLWYEKSRQRLLLLRDSIFQRFAEAASMRLKTGETNLLEKATAESRVAEAEVALAQNRSDIKIYQTRLQTLLNADTSVDIEVDELEKKPHELLPDTTTLGNNPTLALFQQNKKVIREESAVERSKLLPDITIGYFNQSQIGEGQDVNGNPVIYNSGNRFDGFLFGLAIPLWFKPQQAKINAGRLKVEQSNVQYEIVSNALNGRLNELLQQTDKFRTSIRYYKAKALPQADLILKQSLKGFESGEIGYVEYIQGLDSALATRLNYLKSLNQYNQTIIQIEFMTGINKHYRQ